MSKLQTAAARRYAKALLELAEKAGEQDQIAKNLTELVAVWEGSKDLRSVFENPSVSGTQRRAVLEEVCKRMLISALLQNTLFLLADRRRLGCLPQLSESYHRLAEARAGRLRARVTTAGPMPERYFGELKKALEVATGKTVTIEHQQDPSLIGGVVTEVGGKIFDGSLKNQLQELKEELLAQ